MAIRTFGHIPGHPAGTTFASRREASEAGVHRPLQGGICGGADGAESVVVSGGYVDDLDYGHEIIYTGHGGRDTATGLQIADQELLGGNLGLARSYLNEIPVRVVRGHQGEPWVSPPVGYRYDGLYKVTNFWQEVGKDGFRIWRFRLESLEAEATELPIPDLASRATKREPPKRARRATAEYLQPVQIVRDIHDHRCQICALRLETPAGPHAQVRHVRATEPPHSGPHTMENLLCLCPNDAIRFTSGSVYVDDDYFVHDALQNTVIGRLRLTAEHPVSREHLRYHRHRFAGRLST
ncbi:YDG/SRA domain-containing protein [Mycobacterium sp. NPDC050551]|uniref:YDG/SRA domain-containing protein n=1 Tax=Mycobacterium sp. NPDC050551 TaxID=3155407 RepID=UPI003442E608